MLNWRQPFDWFRRRRDARYIATHPVPDELWATAVALPALMHLLADDCAKLKRKVQLFMRDKSFYSAHGFVITDWMRLRIATEACLPTLHIDASCYTGFHSIVVYETAFIAHHEDEDAIGVVHQRNEVMSGESWSTGPVLLSWQDLITASDDGGNLVLHEFAHKLDLLSGDTNGFPPLRQGMSSGEWSAAFSAGYARAARAVEAGHHPKLDPYGVEDPAEFFAVVMEAFFMTPTALVDNYPELYAQLKLWTGQDPAPAHAAAAYNHNPLANTAQQSPVVRQPLGTHRDANHPKPRRTPGSRGRHRTDHHGGQSDR